MKKSCFARYVAADGISIARGTPKWFQGRIYLPLAPSWDLINYWKTSKDEEGYTRRYNEEVLSKLDPNKVIEDLGYDSTILCHCNGFCHRHLVAKWLEDNLGIEVEEYEFKYRG